MRRQITILLVIRNLELRQLYHEILTVAGWEVVIADEAAKGLLALVTHEVNLVIVDVKSNQQEVERFFQIIVRKEAWGNIPIILLDYDDRQSGIRIENKQLRVAAKLNTHLITPNQLIETVEAAIKI